MSGYTVLSRRKSDGRWSFIGTMDEKLAAEQDIDSLEKTVVKLPRNFLGGAKVNARVMGGDWFFVPNNRDAIIKDD